MTKEKKDKTGGGNYFLAGYGWQVLAVPLLAVALLLVFFWLFGYDANLIWTNVVVLAVWFFLVLYAFRRRPHGEVWRGYRWIIAPVVLILLFLFDTSWAQSTLSLSSMAKSSLRATPPDRFQVQAEYPLRIPFDNVEPSEIRLWITGTVNCIELDISAKGLVFAVKPPSEAPLQWSDKLTLKFNGTKTAITLLVQPSNPLETNSQTVQLNLDYGGKNLETQDWKIVVESKRDSQIRGWQKSFLDTAGTIVSLIAAVFAGVKQLEEEKRRQRAEQIKQSLSTYDADVKKDFLEALEKHRNLTVDWNEWDKGLQDQFRDAYSIFITEKLWDVLANQTVMDIQRDVKLCMELCERIFDDKKETATSIIRQLLSALERDENAPFNLPTILKEHPASIYAAKQVAAAFPPELKKKTVDELTGKFPDQIRDLRAELGMPDTESFPLQTQFAFHAKPHIPEDRLTAWLRTHELDCSPFADVDSPFVSVMNGQLLVDLASPGFEFSAFGLQNLTLEFANSWDAGAGWFAYCQSLKPLLRSKEETFFVPVHPCLVMNHEAVDPRKLYLHALAEQWIWSLAETPTMFYSLRGEQLDLAGRLIRWHDLSPSITAYKIAQFAKSLPEKENKNQTIVLSKITEWLNNKDGADLRTEEVNALIGLRPSSQHKTLFLISTIDPNPRVEKQISPDLHESLAEQSDWLSAHNCGFVRFAVGSKSGLTISDSNLVNQCKIRVQKCSKNKLEFNQLFDAPGEEPDAILAQIAGGSPGKMVRLGQKLLLQHAAKPSPEDYLQIEDLIALK
jgi:hypothetical protein